MLEAMQAWWSATLLAAAVYLVVRLLDVGWGARVPASIRIMAYALVFVRLLVPVHSQGAGAVLPSTLLELESAPEGAHVGLAQAPTQPSDPAIPWPLVVYGLGAAAIAGTFVRRAWRERATVEACEPATGADGRDVLVHADAGPAVIGLIRPRVIVPRQFSMLPTHVQRCVLAHERAHVAGGDPWIAGTLRLAMVLAWPFPPCWIAARRIRVLLELRADVRARRTIGMDAKLYGRALVGVAALGRSAFMPALSAFRALEERVAALRTPSSLCRWRSATLCLVGVCATACSVRRAPVPGETPSTPPAASVSAGPEEAEFERLEGSASIVVLQPKTAWGTPATVGSLESAAARLAEQRPGAILVVRDISRRGGGHLPPHRTHRDGREVDVSWPLGDDGQLDTAAAWALLEALAVDPQLQALGVDAATGRLLLDSAPATPVGQRLASLLDPSKRTGPSAGGPLHLHVRFAR